MDFENNSGPKKSVIIIGFLGVLLVVVLVGYFFISRPPGNTPPEVSPTPQQSLTQPVSAIPTVNYTTPFPVVSIPVTGTPENLMKDQIESDKRWSETYNQARDETPWIDDFPIMSEYFFLYFQSGNNKFIGKIYDKSQEDTLKQTMLNILKDKNIDINKYSIEWTYPE